MSNRKEEIQKVLFDKFEAWIFNAGSFFSDAGAAMGVLPKNIWKKSIQTDQQDRIEFATNLLLIKTHRENILVDTGIGYYPDDKQIKIYSPQPSKLLEYLEICGCERNDIDYVVLTHLHHDHIGGLIYREGGTEELMFPLAEHIIQKDEWETALNPDNLNKAAYSFNKPIQLLKASRNIRIIDGDIELVENVFLQKVGAHSEGMQIVRLEDDNHVLFYPSDIISNELHLPSGITSAYDLNRKETYVVKEEIYKYLEKKKGCIVFNHQVDKKIVSYPLKK